MVGGNSQREITLWSSAPATDGWAEGLCSNKLFILCSYSCVKTKRELTERGRERERERERETEREREKV